MEEIRGDMLKVRLRTDLERQMPQTQRRWFHMSQVGRKLPSKDQNQNQRKEVR